MKNSEAPTAAMTPSMSNLNAAFEKHFTPAELAKIWNVSVNTIRRLFYDEPGVLKIGASGRRRKRDYITLRIPAAVAERMHRERSRGFSEKQAAMMR